jgi:hypothetical protein
MRDWGLPRPPEYFVERLTELQRRIRDRVWEASAARTVDAMAEVAADREGDTTFAIDLDAEEILEEFFTAWGDELPVLLIAEGQPGDGSKTYPAGISRSNVAFTCIVDPIDGTRGLMYQKRSAWVLAGVAPPPSKGPPTLDRICLAVQTELPTARSHLSDVLWAVRGEGVEAETQNLETIEARPFTPRPSRADSLRYGFAAISKFFPGGKVLAAEIEERLMETLLGELGGGNPLVFDDEYISSGGQLYELIVGHDRFIADLRPLLFALTETPGDTHRLCAHPYDLCTELIAREAGVVVTDERGQRLQTALDIRLDCGWIGYANRKLRAQIEPVLLSILQEISSMETGKRG